MTADGIEHLAGWVLGVLGAAYAAYPELPTWFRVRMSRGLVSGLAAGGVSAVAFTVLFAPALGLAALLGGGASAGEFVVYLLQTAVVALDAGLLFGLVAGTASLAAGRPPPRSLRNVILTAVWLLLAGTYFAVGLGLRRAAASTIVIVGVLLYSMFAAVYVGPPSLTRWQRRFVLVALPAAFLVLATVVRLVSAAGEAGTIAAVVLDAAFLLLAVCSMFAVLAFVLCAPAPASRRAPSIARFLGGAAIGLVVAIVPLSLDAVLVKGSTGTLTLAMPVGLLVAALNGEGRQLLHTPRVVLARTADGVRLGSANRDRFLHGALVGGVFNLVQSALIVSVAFFVPGGFLGVPPAAPNVPEFFFIGGVVSLVSAGAFALVAGILNLTLRLLIARLELLPRRSFIVPGIAMIAAGGFLIDHEALLRLLGF